MKYAFVISGGVARGAFQAGVLKILAEAGIIPSVIVGTSAGALNGCFISKLIAENKFKPSYIEKILARLWIKEASWTNLWNTESSDPIRTLRDILGDIRPNPFIIRKIARFHTDAWEAIKKVLSFNFLSIINNKFIEKILDDFLTPPDKIYNNIIFSVTITDLKGSTKKIYNQILNDYSKYVTFPIIQENISSISEMFSLLKKVVLASTAFPGLFPPVEVELEGEKKLYSDGGLFKNSPFGHAIKLDNEVTKIFLISSSTITKPPFENINNFIDLLGSIYEVVLNKDIINDFKKIIDINKKIEMINKLCHKDENNNIIFDEFNDQICKIGGFSGIEDFISKRKIEIIIIEPDQSLSGNPFSGLYAKNREYIMETYVNHGYEVGKRVLKNLKLYTNKVIDYL